MIADDVTLADASADLARLARRRRARARRCSPRAGARRRGLAPHGWREVRIAGAAGRRGGLRLHRPARLPALRPRRRARTRCAAALLAARRRARRRPRRSSVCASSAGVPWLGRELDESVLPGRGAPRGARSRTTKGCYTGQEVVTRMRSRGRVGHLLVGLRFEGDALPAPRRRDRRRDGPRSASVTSACSRPTRARSGSASCAPRTRSRARACAWRAPRGRGARRCVPRRERSRSSSSRSSRRRAQVKTRLCPPFTPEQAAALLRRDARGRARDDARRLRGARPRGRARGASARGGAELAGAAPACAGERAARRRSRRAHGARGRARARRPAARPVLLRGSDSPTLGLATLSAALAALARTRPRALPGPRRRLQPGRPARVRRPACSPIR